MAEETLQQPAEPEKRPNVFQKAWRGSGRPFRAARDRWYRTKLFRGLERTYLYKFFIGLKKDNLFWSRFNGAFNGALLIGQAWLGLHVLPKHIPKLLSLLHAAALPAAPLIAHAAVIAVSAALGAVGVCALGFGFVNAWKSMEGLCSRIFPKFNLLRKFRLRTGKIVKGIASVPPLRQVLGGIKNIAGRIVRKPLAQKFLKSRLGRLVRGPSQTQQDVFLAGVTIEGSTAFAIGFPAYVASRVAALPAITTVGGLAALAAVAAFTIYEVVDCTLSVTSSIKTLTQIRRARKAAKQAAAQAPAAVPAAAPPVQEVASSPLTAQAAPAFNSAANDDVSATVSPAAGSSPAAPVSKPLQPKQA